MSMILNDEELVYFNMTDSIKDAVTQEVITEAVVNQSGLEQESFKVLDWTVAGEGSCEGDGLTSDIKVHWYNRILCLLYT